MKKSKYKRDLTIFTNYSEISEKEHKLISELGGFRDLCVLTKEGLELAQNKKYDFTISEEEFNAAFFDKIIEDLSKSEVFEKAVIKAYCDKFED